MSNHNFVHVTITNGTGFDLSYIDQWFGEGSLADGQSWPTTITSGQSVQVTCCSSDVFDGCIGYVEYAICGTDYFLAFSNPREGDNGIGMGTADPFEGAGPLPSSYTYPSTDAFQAQGDAWLTVEMTSSPGDVNDASWIFATQDLRLQERNIVVSDVNGVFASLDDSSQRRIYFRCGTDPVVGSGYVQSHFKGIGLLGDRVIFTHTNLYLTPQAYGRFLYGDMAASGPAGSRPVTATVDTLYEGWPHPCGAQTCGSFLAMGIQAAASGRGSDRSAIQVIDARQALINRPMSVLATIARASDGINGVGMTKELGGDGRYVIAAVNGNVLDVYASRGGSLIGLGDPDDAFTDVLHDESFDASGAGLALVTQADGTIFLISLNADDDGSNSLMNLYRLDLDSMNPSYAKIGSKPMPVRSVSECVSWLGDAGKLAELLLHHPESGAVIESVYAYGGSSLLNSSFRWGKGLAITSENSISVYASDRNVLPWTSIDPDYVGDFSVLVWSSPA